MTFEDVLRYVGRQETEAKFEAVTRTPGPPEVGAAARGSGGSGCGSGGCGCAGTGDGAAPGASRRGPGLAPEQPGEPVSAGLPSGGSSSPAGVLGPTDTVPAPEADSGTLLGKNVDRRQALKMLFGAAAVTTQAASACSPASLVAEEEREAKLLEWEEYFKGNFQRMTDEEKADTIRRLERLAQIRQGVDISIDATEAQPGVVYGYAFNISKCMGYRNCVDACIKENNLDRESGAQYIRIFEMEGGEMDFDDGDATYHHEVPAEGHFYVGTQCFQCANPPCVEVCPVSATWQEPDGITVVDYDWCIGCRYCMAACPYWARRFNWSEPEVPAEELNPNQHYLGNRARKNGVVEKCTFCIQRSRKGLLPACAEACPTGARVFGNLLDPDSEIRWVLENKQVFRLKEELHTEPRFWYFMD